MGRLKKSSIRTENPEQYGLTVKKKYTTQRYK